MRMHVLGALCLVLRASCLMLVLGAHAAAQEQAVDPIRCWRQASAGAVNIGEEFTVVLTCAVLDTPSIQVVPEEGRLGVASIQMAPFEILGGAHPPDVRRGPRRFFQYDYQLRIISADAIGHDVNVPPLSIPYRVRSQVGAAAKLEGRDLSYLLPPLPIKISSMVPADASDIRDASDASFAAVDSFRYRSNLFRILALVLGLLAAVVGVLAFLPLARRATAAASPGRERLSDAAILKRIAQEIADVRDQVGRAGWTDEALARSLGAVRLLGTTAIGGPVSQKRVAPGVSVSEGRLAVRTGIVRPSMTAISSSLTADDVARAANDAPSRSVTERQRFDGIQSALAALTAAAYQANPSRETNALDEVLRNSAGLAKELQGERNWLRSLWPR